ncbi:MAG: LD-carboxypeptidase [Defluviitaleaceae bacterium]|nr:LD-carboxypeptidase [Defluviitaleaceae bacterium]
MQPLQKGDTIAITATAGICNPKKLAQGVQRLKDMGLKVQVMESCRAAHGEYLAGTDSLRLDNLHTAFADPQIKAVFAARGGYGTGRLLPYLDYALIRQNPKIFVGYSDVTALHIVLNQRCGLPTFHGDMPGTGFTTAPLTFAQTIPATGCLYPGVATGLLVGGNLSVVASTLGTPYEINTRGRILFLEETQEPPYRVDRLLLQLKLAGKLDDAAGLAFGDMGIPGDMGTLDGPRPESLGPLALAIQELVLPAQKPTLWGLPCGHTSPNVTLPLGTRVTLLSQSPQRLSLALPRLCLFSQTCRPG